MFNENILSALIIFSSGMFLSYFGQSNIISLLGIYTGLIYIILICVISKYSITNNNTNNFSTIEKKDIVLKKEKIDVLFFFAPWCPYSQKALPLWEKVKQVYANDSSKRFILVNSEDDIDNLVDKHDIKSYPSFLVVKENGRKYIFRDERTSENLSDFIEKKTK